MKYLLTVIFLFTCATLLAQVNLVKNPSFEQYSQCPFQDDQIRFANFWSPIDTISTNPLCSPEYCNTCTTIGGPTIPYDAAFYQYPRTGNGMAQVQVFEMNIPDSYQRDYLQGRLYHPLIAGKQYCVTFYVVYEELSGNAIANIGAFFDNGGIDNTDSLGCALPQTTHIPQVENTTIISDTLNWTKIEGTFTATGTEKFTTIGNFRDKAHTNYTSFVPWPGSGGDNWSWYLVDDVSVIASDAVAYAGHDTAIGFGDSVYIGLHDEAMPCTWTKLGSSTVIHDGAGMWVKPTATTKYIVKQTLCGVSTYDTVTITVWPQSVNSLTGSSFAKIFPNPASNILHIHVLKPYLHYQLQNMLGITALQGELQQGDNILVVETLPAGVYLLELMDAEGLKAVMRVVKE
jgi:hypothetical protein